MVFSTYKGYRQGRIYLTLIEEGLDDEAPKYEPAEQNAV